MILVLSGEGPTDIGARRPKVTGWEFVPGPMTWIVDRLLARPDKLNYSVLELHAGGADCVCFLSESELSALRYPKPKFFPREHGTPGGQFFRASAYQLGKHALTVASERGAAVMAVFFRDGDGTRSTPRAEWAGKFTSIENGFQVAGFPSGVPMVPRPKSEAWMLCGLLKRENKGGDCSWLEDEPGNDASPNSLKTRLEQKLGYQPTTERQAELVSSGVIDPELIDLSSFKAFRDALEKGWGGAISTQ